MADASLAQAEADALIGMKKRRADSQTWAYPDFGGAITVPLISVDRRERFLLDLRRSQINLAKGTYQNRARQVVVLARLDFGGSPHRNPDDKLVESPHLHLYREGFGDKWAFPVPDRFMDLSDPSRTLDDFMAYCNIVEPPTVSRSLFT